MVRWLSLLLLIGGCTNPKPFTTPPSAPAQVCVSVDWMKPMESCKGEDANGCSTKLSNDWYALTIPQPSGWGDTHAMETAGHELMHALGARHDDN